MKKIIFSAIIFLSLSSYAVSADINWSLGGTASCSGGATGTPVNVKDDDTGTYYGDRCNATYRCSWDYSCEVAFVETVNNITKVEIHYYRGGSWSGQVLSRGSWYVDLYYTGTWNEVMSGAWGQQPSTTVTESDSTGWTNVSKIRLRAEGYVGSLSGEPGDSEHKTFELRAWGPKNYLDIGLRVKKPGETIKIGVKRLGSSHKLRIRKGNISYGIPLLDSDDGDASPIRIYDGSTVKALPRID